MDSSVKGALIIIDVLGKLINSAELECKMKTTLNYHHVNPISIQITRVNNELSQCEVMLHSKTLPLTLIKDQLKVALLDAGYQIGCESTCIYRD